MKKTAAFLSTALLLMPLAASADTLSDLQAQVAALIAQIKTLQQQIATLPDTPAPAAPAASSAASATGLCASLSHSFGLGSTDASTGGDVTRLQQFLNKAYKDFNSLYITGSFSDVTEQALKQWQSERRIVSSGDAETTGWGWVGPKTRAALASGCPKPAPSTSASVSGGYSAGVSVTHLGLSATTTVTVNTRSSCSAQTYSFDYGDGSVRETIFVPGSSCAPVTKVFPHTYAEPGTYTITISSGSFSIPYPITLEAGCPVVRVNNPSLPQLKVGTSFTARLFSYSDTRDQPITVSATGTPPGTILTDEVMVGATSTSHVWTLSGAPVAAGRYTLDWSFSNPCGRTSRNLATLIINEVAQPTSCPQYYYKPACSGGFTLVATGYDGNGCGNGYRCVSDSQANACPSYTVTQCPAGQHRVYKTPTYDARYCPVVNSQCVSDSAPKTSSCTTYVPPTCPSGYVTVSDEPTYDANNCPVANAHCELGTSVSSAQESNVASVLAGLEGALKSIIDFFGASR